MHDIRPILPELFEQPGNLLYIGARADAHSWLEEFREAGNQVAILEIWHDNVKGLQEIFQDTIILTGSVRDVLKLTADMTFDYIVWWHGPEHLEMNDAMIALAHLESKAQKMVALACPYGWYPQSSHAGNPYETHLSTLYPHFFQLMGYEVKTDGPADKPGSEIVAWKKRV